LGFLETLEAVLEACGPFAEGTQEWEAGATALRKSMELTDSSKKKKNSFTESGVLARAALLSWLEAGSRAADCSGVYADRSGPPLVDSLFAVLEEEYLTHCLAGAAVVAKEVARVAKRAGVRVAMLDERDGVCQEWEGGQDEDESRVAVVLSENRKYKLLLHEVKNHITGLRCHGLSNPNPNSNSNSNNSGGSELREQSPFPRPIIVGVGSAGVVLDGEGESVEVWRGRKRREAAVDSFLRAVLKNRFEDHFSLEVVRLVSMSLFAPVCLPRGTRGQLELAAVGGLEGWSAAEMLERVVGHSRFFPVLSVPVPEEGTPLEATSNTAPCTKAD
ncbi:unnamed protein product, partial [Choristocarpus tenellus]